VSAGQTTPNKHAYPSGESLKQQLDASLTNSRVSGALCSLLSDAGGALPVVGSRCGGEHLLHVKRQRGGWHVDAVLEQGSPHEHSQPRKCNTSPSGSVYFAASSAQVPQSAHSL
jgi:hypothetical protein